MQSYTQAELLALFDTPVMGDASISLAHQLIAAKLNVANGSDSTPIAATIAAADALLAGFAGKLPYGVDPSSATGQAMETAAGQLDSYNMGQLTPGCSTVKTRTVTPARVTATSIRTATPTRTGALAATPTPTSASAGACPLTQGFWKNHPRKWPVMSLTLGSQTYSQQELLVLLSTPVHGNASINLARQLIAAKLSIANGADPGPVTATISSADSVLSGFSEKLPYHVPASSPVGQTMVDLAGTLNSYNNGQLTAGCGMES